MPHSPCSPRSSSSFTTIDIASPRNLVGRNVPAFRLVFQPEPYAERNRYNSPPGFQPGRRIYAVTYSFYPERDRGHLSEATPSRGLTHFDRNLQQGIQPVFLTYDLELD